MFSRTKFLNAVWDIIFSFKRANEAEGRFWNHFLGLVRARGIGFERKLPWRLEQLGSAFRITEFVQNAATLR